MSEYRIALRHTPTGKADLWRYSNGKWDWHCRHSASGRLCPFTDEPFNSWQEAMDALNEHIRLWHV